MIAPLRQRIVLLSVFAASRTSASVTRSVPSGSCGATAKYGQTVTAICLQRVDGLGGICKEGVAAEAGRLIVEIHPDILLPQNGAHEQMRQRVAVIAGRDAAQQLEPRRDEDDRFGLLHPLKQPARLQLSGVEQASSANVFVSGMLTGV